MSKKFKSQASSAKAASGFGGFAGFATTTSPLSYIAEQPDLSQIADASVVVAFKNLTKKDSITKSKALDELLASTASHDDLAVLTAWTDLYPRVSIDNSQIVRRNAHALQGTYTVTAGKKIAPLLSKLVPSWLAGTVDNDKSVARAASEALEHAFATPEKRDALWKLYRDSIHERVEDSLLIQSAGTLSDERVTSSDEAQFKYVRVVGTALYLLSQLLNFGLERLDILQEKKLWDLVHHEDAYIRNAVCGLLITTLSRESYTQALDWSVLSTAFLYKALHKSQMGSSLLYAKSLCRLTEVRPTLWTSDYAAKTSVGKRLFSYLQNGSDNGPLEVWPSTLRLVKSIPTEVWKSQCEDLAALAQAYRTGVLKERLHVEAAWRTYINLCMWLSQLTDSSEKGTTLLEEQVIPIITAFVSKSSEEQWRLGIRGDNVATAAVSALQSEHTELQTKLWSSLSGSLIERMRLSLPESSKDFHASQDGVAAQSLRYKLIQETAGRTKVAEEHTITCLNAALELLRSRNGKPYGAAHVVHNLVVGGGLSKEISLQSFLNKDLASLLASPSAEQLTALALTVKFPVGEKLLSAASSSNTSRALRYFAKSAGKQEIGEIQIGLVQRLDTFETEESRVLAITLLSNRDLPASLRSELLQRVVQVLEDSNTSSLGLSLLKDAASTNMLSQLIADAEYGQQLTSKLLVLGDSTDVSVAEQASAIAAGLNTVTNISASTISTIRKQLNGEEGLVSILTITDLGVKLAANVDLAELLPDASMWQKALQPHLVATPPTSVSITNPMHGAIWLIAEDTTSGGFVVRDGEDFSLLFRITFFLTGVLKSVMNNSPFKDGAHLESLFYYYPIALQFVNEKLTLDSANSIWLGSTDEVINAAADTLSEGFQIVSKMQEEETFAKLWHDQFQVIQGKSRFTYYHATTWIGVMSDRISKDPRAMLSELESELQAARKSSEPVRSAALFALTGDSFLDTQSGLRTINELIADITSTPSNFQHIMYLNVLLQANSAVLNKVPQQRLVFLFQKLTNFLREEADGASILSEGFALVAKITPFVADIFGEHWSVIMDAVMDIWEFLAADDIALLHGSLLTFEQIRKAASVEDVNDDLLETINAKRENVSAGLLQSLKALGNVQEVTDQPREITAELLRRQLANIEVDEMIEIFPLLDSRMATIRATSYELLHRAIPKQQESRSIELALGDSRFELPQELLFHVISDDQPQTYSLSWKLIFDHYTNASHNLREAYTVNLKQGAQIGTLLDFICEKIRLTSGRPIDPSKFEIDRWELGDSLLDEQHLQSLSIHLYYLALSFVPSLVKDWFLQQKNRIKTPLESWTEKHITPLILTSSLSAVKDWAASQSSDSSDRVIEIKSSPRSQELTASIPVDPESPPVSISITFPGSYPLISPVVNARTRVGVSEKNFTAWLRTIQIIIFSTGSIIEGLIAFRKNVQGELTGQTECAICYSIIGTDMQTPNKKCGTCKNMFHGVCLFKWFRSSNSSSCPLCRNNFNYA